MRWKETLKLHWPEYLMEAALLGLFMVSACSFSALLDYPNSPAHTAVTSSFVRRMLVGIAMGLTAVILIYSPWGKQSGAHLNPVVTLTFYRLGKVAGSDALFYVLAQFTGGILGVLLSLQLLQDVIRHPSVNYVLTLPGSAGVAIAFAAEVLISFLMMSVVLRASNHVSLSRFTGLFAGGLVALYITIEAPLSGMSMNPARTFGSAFSARAWTSLWVYFTAPALGMLAAAELYVRLQGIHRVFCAKYHHHNDKRCIFRCDFGGMQPERNLTKEVIQSEIQ